MSTSKAKKSPRSRYFTFVLYPENRYHSEYLEWCKHHENGFYIVHDEEKHVREGAEGYVFDTSAHKEDKKKHIHCLIYFENARTLSGFLKSFPSVDYYVIEEDENGTPVKVSTIPVFDCQQEKTIQKPLLSTAQIVNDMYALSHYFIHDNFECKMFGKKQYSVSDVKMFNNSSAMFDKYFKQCLEFNNDIVSELYQIAISVNFDRQKFLSAILSADVRYLKYVESHSSFLDRFMFFK